jgi:hypothetical protein
MSGYSDYWSRFKNDRVKTGKKHSSFISGDDYEFDDSDYRGKSVSRVGAYIKSYDDFKPESAKDVLNDASCKLIRLLNSVRNSASGELPLQIQWEEMSGTDAPRNTQSDTDIFLSPDVVIKNQNSPEIIDSLGGYCLMAATQKRTTRKVDLTAALVDNMRLKDVTRPFEKHERNRISCKLIAWQAIEASIAAKELVKEWPGASMYLHRHKVANCAKKDDVQKYVDENQNVEGMIAAFSWVLNNPNNPISIPEKIQPALEEAINKVVEYSSGDNRYDGASEAVIKIALKTLEFKEEKGSGGGGGGGGGGGKNDGGSDSSGTENIPNSSDPTMTVQRHKSSLSKTDLPDALKTTDDLDVFDVPKIPPGAARFDKGELIDAGDVSGFKCGLIAKGSPCELKNRYSILVKQSESITKSVLSALRFRANENGSPVYGQESGDIDDGSLFKLTERRGTDFKIYQKTQSVSFPHVVFGILLDQSGSMSGSIRSASGSRKIDDAKVVCVGIHEALKRIKQVDQYIAGHNANHRDCYEGLGHYALFEYVTSNQSDSRNISRAAAGGNNADGYAIQLAVTRMAKLHPSTKNKSLCVVSDGAPSADGIDGKSYGGDLAFSHIKSVCEWSWRKHKIKVIAIGVGNAYPEVYGNKMYGEGNHVIIGDVLSSAMIIARFLKKVTSRTR